MDSIAIPFTTVPSTLALAQSLCYCVISANIDRALAIGSGATGYVFSMA